MKKSDIAMVILIAAVSMMIAFFVAQSLFGSYDGKATVKTINKINSSVVQPSPKIFNKDAINPTVHVEINTSSTNDSAS